MTLPCYEQFIVTRRLHQVKMKTKIVSVCSEPKVNLSHMNACKDHDHCHMIMTKEDNNIL